MKGIYYRWYYLCHILYLSLLKLMTGIKPKGPLERDDSIYLTVSGFCGREAGRHYTKRHQGNHQEWRMEGHHQQVAAAGKRNRKLLLVIVSTSES